MQINTQTAKGQLRGISSMNKKAAMYNEELRKSTQLSSFHPHNEDNRPHLPHGTECTYVSILTTGKHQMNDRVGGGVLKAPDCDSPEMSALKMQIPEGRLWEYESEISIIEAYILEFLKASPDLKILLFTVHMQYIQIILEKYSKALKISHITAKLQPSAPLFLQ